MAKLTSGCADISEVGLKSEEASTDWGLHQLPVLSCLPRGPQVRARGTSAQFQGPRAGPGPVTTGALGWGNCSELSTMKFSVVNDERWKLIAKQ